jgi:hypothetical protein
MSGMGFFGPSLDPVSAELRLDIEAVLHFVLPAIQADVPPRTSTDQGTMFIEALIVLGMHNKRDRVSRLDNEGVDPAAGNHGSGEPLCFFTGRYVSKTQLRCLGIRQHQPCFCRMERQPEGVASPSQSRLGLFKLDFQHSSALDMAFRRADLSLGTSIVGNQSPTINEGFVEDFIRQ